MNYYLIRVHEDVEPEVLGPYGELRRDEKAKEIRKEDPGDPSDSLFMLTIDEYGRPEVASYSAAFLEKV